MQPSPRQGACPSWQVGWPACPELHRFVISPTYFSISSYQDGLVEVRFVLWAVTQYYFILWLGLFQL